jgi:type VI protein secretion system component VasK
MQKSDGWHVLWVLVLVVGVVSLGFTLAIALYHRESSTFANVASIWGLFVGLIGFSVTIYTLFETQRISRKAQQAVQTATIEAQQAIQKAAREAEEAVRNAQQQTRQVLERVRNANREADFSTLLMWVRELAKCSQGG